MSEEQVSGFKISDRRKFNPDGSPREGVAEAEPASAPVVPPQSTTAAQAATSPPPQAFRPEDVSSTAARPAPEPTHAEPEPMDEEVEMTEFMQFLYSLASSTAFIHLGLMEHPATGRAEVNLPAAQQGIGMLMLLQEKTKGNLTHTEEKFFTTLLADLQMQFVSLRRQ